jgi:hypothetical protein
VHCVTELYFCRTRQTRLFCVVCSRELSGRIRIATKVNRKMVERWSGHEQSSNEKEKKFGHRQKWGRERTKNALLARSSGIAACRTGGGGR